MNINMQKMIDFVSDPEFEFDHEGKHSGSFRKPGPETTGHR